MQVELKAGIGVPYAEGMTDIVKGHPAITNRKDTKHCDISVRVLEPSSKVHGVPPAEDVQYARVVAVFTAEVKAAVASKLTNQVRKQPGSASAPCAADCSLQTMPPQDLLLVRWFLT